jgi:sugar phosphate isomerase/epimerase
VESGYDKVMSYEHEDPVMSKADGAEKCIEFLKPLMIKRPLQGNSIFSFE